MTKLDKILKNTKEILETLKPKELGGFFMPMTNDFVTFLEENQDEINDLEDDYKAVLKEVMEADIKKLKQAIKKYL